MTERDQAQRIYKAQFQAGFRQIDELTLGECQQYINKILASKFVREKYLRHDIREIFVTDGRGRRNAGAGYGFAKGSVQPVIKLPHGMRCRYVILHELAHHFARLSERHKAKFASIYLDLIKEFLGEEPYQKLLTQFARCKVKIIKGNGEIGQATAPKSFQEIA